MDPSTKINGPSDWGYLNDVMDRETVILQKSEIADKSFNKEPTMLILKDKHIRKGWFSLDLAGYNNGAIGVVFKYIDANNYYLFEIGGYLAENRYFELRKKVNGMMKPIKRINSNEELEKSESLKSRDFGYTPFKWYYLRVDLTGPSIKIFYKNIGHPEKLVMEINDNDIASGYIGLTSFNTKAIFDNLILRPKVEEMKFSFSAASIPVGVNPDEDVYLYDQEDKGKNKIFNYFS